MAVVLPEPTLVVPSTPFPKHGHIGADEWLISFGAPAKIWSINERMHWAQSGALRSTWREGTAKAARGLRPKPGRWYIQVSLPFRRDSERRDPHNFTGTVVKSIIDGLGPPTDESPGAGLWPDDIPEYVVMGDPIIRICPRGAFPHLVVGVHGMRLEQRT